MPRRADPLPANRFWEMVTWAQTAIPDGPKALVAAVTPGSGLRLASQMILEPMAGGAFRFRPDHLAEPALIERLCRLKPNKNFVRNVATKALVERDSQFQGTPGPELLSLMMRIMNGSGPNAISTPSTEIHRLALCRIIQAIANKSGIQTARSKHTDGMRSACDVAASAWPDQIKSANSAIRTWYNHKDRWWVYVNAIDVTEKQLNVSVRFSPMSIPATARSRLRPDQQLNVTVTLPKTEADYSSDLWLYGGKSEVKEILMQGITELTCQPPYRFRPPEVED